MRSVWVVLRELRIGGPRLPVVVRGGTYRLSVVQWLSTVMPPVNRTSPTRGILRPRISTTEALAPSTGAARWPGLVRRGPVVAC